MWSALALAVAACTQPQDARRVSVALDDLTLSDETVRPGVAAFMAACPSLKTTFRAACDDRALAQANPVAFLRRHFTAYEVLQGKAPGGFFTGYFEPQIDASRTRAPGYDTPIYGRPDDLVAVDLGAFRDDLKGRRIAGTVQSGRLVPFADRAQIESGRTPINAPILAWAADPIELFFLHIQGSGVLRFPNGSAARIGYAAQNGHVYTAIGRPLIARGALDKETISLETIAAWLRHNPGEADALMRQNRSFVFFKDNGTEGPFGSLGTVLPARAAVAVDPLAVPLGSLVLVDVTLPHDGSRLNRLLLAADTGGAIRGLGRGDIFFGQGPQARAAASSLKTPGRFIVFEPKPPEPSS